MLTKRTKNGTDWCRELDALGMEWTHPRFRIYVSETLAALEGQNAALHIELDIEKEVNKRVQERLSCCKN